MSPRQMGGAPKSPNSVLTAACTIVFQTGKPYLFEFYGPRERWVRIWKDASTRTTQFADYSVLNDVCSCPARVRCKHLLFCDTAWEHWDELAAYFAEHQRALEVTPALFTDEYLTERGL